MKVFAILTACLMTAGGATYYLSSDGCPFSSCPVAKSGGCCATDSASAEASANCTKVCPACVDDCLECCVVCEDCCVAGAQVTAVAKAKSDCCAKLETCCEKATACCADKASPADIATSAVVAGASVK